ncbi:MAG: hypothetical protein WDM86_08215 [Rhizomicrobium sp.]
MHTPRIFVSMGTPYTETYAKFRDTLEDFLRSQCQCDPRIIGKNEYPTGSPIGKIAEVMRGCDGVMIVAYERKYVQAGVERRGGANETRLSGEIYTTAWNHIESAIAYSLGLPIYIIAQKGLKEEGLIESKTDWYVQKIDFTSESLRHPDVVGSIQAWIRERVATRGKKRRAALEGFAFLKISDFTMEDWALLGALVGGSFGLGVAAAHWLHIA